MLTLSFLFDNYGLYPNDLVEDSFIIDDKLYKIEEVQEYSEDDFISLYNYSLELKKLFNNTFELIKNRKNNYLTNYANKSYVLISTPIYKVSLQDIIKYNRYFYNKDNRVYSISQMINVWLERYNNIQKDCFNALCNDDIIYNNMYIAVSFSFGLAENALSYLADAKIDYGDEIERLTLTHIRLNLLDSYSFFNPLNIIYDSVIRDYAELYKFELIDIHDLNKIIDELHITQKEASLLMARILYPTRVFDLLEDNYLSKEHKYNKTIEYLNCLDKELQRIKNAHRLLVKKYNIRPISWLLK